MSAYSLGSIEVLGDREVVHRPWFIAPGEETDLFAAFLRWQRDPPKDQRQADEATAAAFRLCRANPAFLLHQFGRIKLGNSGAGPFNQWTPGQRRLHLVTQRMRAAQRPVRIICLKARRQGVSTWAQQKMIMPSGSDSKQAAQQQMMLWMMPLMFAFLTMQFPSGLALYWVISNAVTIVVQYYITGGWGGLATVFGKKPVRDKKYARRIARNEEKRIDVADADAGAGTDLGADISAGEKISKKGSSFQLISRQAKKGKSHRPKKR